jgi:hypothetical protein
MPDTPVQTPSLIESDLATHQSTHPIPISLPRFVGTIACASPTSTPPSNLSERRKKFRSARLDIDKNVTLQVAYTPKQKYMAAELLRAEYRKLGYDTSFIDNPINTDDKRRLTLLVKEGVRVSGTCSLMLDRPGLRLGADQSHEAYLNVLRQEGKCLIEACRLAVASELADSTSRITLSALIGHTFLCANFFLDYQPYLVLEVNPRHTNYWTNLGFEVLVEKSWCERVNQPSALIGCDWPNLWKLIKVEWQQQLRGSHPNNLIPKAVRRLVRNFIPWEDVDGINRRMTIFNIRASHIK